VLQLRNALKEDPSMAAAHLLLGNLQLGFGRPADAEASFDRALSNGADKAALALPFARAYAAQGKLEILLERSSPQGLPLQPKLEILLLRGTALEKMEDHAAAQRTFEEARALDPYSVPVRLALANTLLATGQVAKAAGLVDEAIKLTPKDPNALVMRASIALRRSDLKAALADYSKAIALDSDNLDAMVAEAGVLIDLGRLEEAERALADIEKIAPGEPYAAYMRASAG
jgi:tetratricopeptide (TPR) repeat protein